ncbi:MAG: ATP-binding protein [Fimbriimonadaceae bacterium]|nr:ATP-binding protein [Fimbriimonadaceae bacterium]
MTDYCSRALERAWARASAQFGVVLLTGPRQVGKTTLLRHLAEPTRRYVTLDDLALRDLAQQDPALFAQRFPPPLLIDEIQYAPRLLPYVKMQVDTVRRPGQYWLTGAQQFPLMAGVTESLAGRVAVVNLYGFSAREADRRPADLPPFLPTASALGPRREGYRLLAAPEVFQRLWRGQYPAVCTGDVRDVELFYRSYLQTYLERDVRSLLNIGDLTAFRRFLRAAAARTGQLLNYADLARDTGISPNAAKQWLSVLVASGQVHLLPPYHTNVTRRLCKTPKLYFLDTGLAAYLTEWRTPETLEAGAMAGAIFESAVVAEVLKSWSNQLQEAPAYFYREAAGREIDLLLVSDGVLHPVEIKKAGLVSARDLATHCLEDLPIPRGPGALVCLAPEPLPLRADLEIIPFGML